MYKTEGVIITNGGIAFLNDIVANSKQPIWTTIKLGNGDISSEEEARALTDLVNVIKDAGISSYTTTPEGYLQLTTNYDNRNLTQDVVVKETGVYGKTADMAEAILVAYINDGIGETMPAFNGKNPIQRARNVIIGITQQLDSVVEIDEGMYATIWDLEKKVNKTTQVTAGNGLVGGGALSSDVILNIASANNGIITNADSIELKGTLGTVIDENGFGQHDYKYCQKAKPIYKQASGALINTGVLALNSPTLFVEITGTKQATPFNVNFTISMTESGNINAFNIGEGNHAFIDSDIELFFSSNYYYIYIKNSVVTEKDWVGCSIFSNQEFATIPIITSEQKPANATGNCYQKFYGAHYLTAGQLGLTVPTTVESIINAMCSYSTCSITDGGIGSAISNVPREYGSLIINKTIDYHYLDIRYECSETLLKYATGYDTPTNSITGFKRVMTEDYANFSVSVNTTGDMKCENLATDAQIGHIARSGYYAYHECRINESDDSENYFRMDSNHEQNSLLYYGSGGLSGTTKTFMSHNKSTGNVTWAGGTFSGNIQADNLPAYQEFVFRIDDENPATYYIGKTFGRITTPSNLRMDIEGQINSYIGSDSYSISQSNLPSVNFNLNTAVFRGREEDAGGGIGWENGSEILTVNSGGSGTTISNIPKSLKVAGWYCTNIMGLDKGYATCSTAPIKNSVGENNYKLYGSEEDLRAEKAGLIINYYGYTGEYLPERLILDVSTSKGSPYIVRVPTQNELKLLDEDKYRLPDSHIIIEDVVYEKPSIPTNMLNPILLSGKNNLGEIVLEYVEGASQVELDNYNYSSKTTRISNIDKGLSLIDIKILRGLATENEKNPLQNEKTQLQKEVRVLDIDRIIEQWNKLLADSVIDQARYDTEVNPLLEEKNSLLV